MSYERSEWSAESLLERVCLEDPPGGWGVWIVLGLGVCAALGAVVGLVQRVSAAGC